jgi:hypothetical protein
MTVNVYAWRCVFVCKRAHVRVVLALLVYAKSQAPTRAKDVLFYVENMSLGLHLRVDFCF